jgi:hypothetical protein
MAISIAVTAWSASSTSPTPTLPASPQAGDLHVLFIVGKPYNLTRNTPSGWTLISGSDGTNGTTASGTQVGSVSWAAYYRYWQSGDGNPSISWTSGFPTEAVIIRFRPDSGYTIDTPVGAKGSDTSSGTGYSATMSTDPGLAAGDVVAHFTGTPNNLAVFSSPTISATGVIFGTVTLQNKIETTTGADGSAALATAPVSSGTSSAAAVCGWTLGAASTGGGSLVRIRETAAGWANIASINGVDTSTLDKIGHDGLALLDVAEFDGVAV